MTYDFFSLEWGPETASGGIHSLGGTDLKKRGESEGGCTYQGRTKIEMEIVTFLHLDDVLIIKVHVLIIILRRICSLRLNLSQNFIVIFLEAKSRDRPVIEWGFALADDETADVKAIWEWHSTEGVTKSAGRVHLVLFEI